jgi:hypothetical protein
MWYTPHKDQAFTKDGKKGRVFWREEVRTAEGESKVIKPFFLKGSDLQ